MSASLSPLASTVPPASRSSYLHIQGLWKRYGDFTALQNIHLDVAEGEFVSFLGPSGCGKTTLLRAIAGLDLQSEGRITQAGRDISKLPPSERDYGIVFQSYALFPNLTIAKNIAFGLEAIGKPRDYIAHRVAELLQLVGLPDQAQKYPAQLSGGQQQRVALARAMAASPGLLLLDEPLSALDAKVRIRLRHEIKELQRTLGVTTIMVTHDQEEALAMSDKIVVMNHGVIEQIGTPQEIYEAPQSLFVSNFIGETNRYPATVASSSRAAIGQMVLDCRPHPLPPSSPVTVAVRPDDIAIRNLGSGPGMEQPNTFQATIASAEFLGSFWRMRVQCEPFSSKPVVVDCTVDAQRRMQLAVGQAVEIAIPAERLYVFSQ